MRFALQPGSVLGCTLNSHRASWNGTICANAGAWNCGRDQEFRETYCERGVDRCFHIHVFDEKDPFLVIDESGCDWVLADDPHALDDQLLLFWGRQFQEPRGVRDEAQGGAWMVFGAYRVKDAVHRERGHRREWVVRPYPDGWARLDRLHLTVPRWEPMTGPYIKQIQRPALDRLVAEARGAAEEVGRSWTDSPDGKRFRAFAHNIPGWMDIASERALRLQKRVAAERDRTDSVTVPPAAPPSAPRNGSIGTSRRAPPSTEPGAAATPQPGTALIEAGARARIAERHGEATLTAVLIASLTKPLLVLRGSPGVGKSDLALGLIDDPGRERTLIVPVSSTWRGREDLLGYVSPLNNKFEPTEFTNFLRRAEQAWDGGDRNARVVVFEEFNLSQPEQWLSDILVRSQYPAHTRSDRVIDLGGEGVRGWPPDAKPAVFLSPAVRFVATINNDHTTRTLSPRVLDRASVVELSVTPADALRRSAVTLEAEQVEALADLDFRIRSRAAAFSYRTAQSLHACLERRSELGLDVTGVLDLVLVHEILSKVRLLAADPADQRLCAELVAWTQASGSKLVQCTRVIAGWQELLQNGQDVLIT